MISQTNSSAIRSAYSSNFGETKETKQVKPTTISAQGDTSKVEQIKEALNSGDYKIDLDALSEMIADELLQ
jgi:anti-sigma28 factor (negative regulator of flagellin synthesis)